MGERAIHYREYFQKREPSRFGLRVHNFWHSRMLEIAEAKISQLRDLTILELGPGFGYFAQLCKSRQYSYLGVEMNAVQAENLRCQGFDVACATIPPIPAGKPVQVIWMSHFIEHATSFLDARQVLDEAYNRLDVEGYVVIISPDFSSWKANFYDVDWSHGYPTTLGRVEQILLETGFEVSYSAHHVATFLHPIWVFILNLFFKFIPTNTLDFFTKKITGRTFFHSFMVLLGWRQIFLIGRKGHSPPQRRPL